MTFFQLVLSLALTTYYWHSLDKSRLQHRQPYWQSVAATMINAQYTGCFPLNTSSHSGPVSIELETRGGRPTIPSTRLPNDSKNKASSYFKPASSPSFNSLLISSQRLNDRTQRMTAHAAWRPVAILHDTLSTHTTSPSFNFPPRFQRSNVLATNWQSICTCSHELYCQ